MFKLKAFSVALAAMAMVACGGGGSNSGLVSPSATPGEDATSSSTLSPSGDTTMTARVTDMTVMGQDDVLASYPELASHITTLESITEVRETNADTFDFYAGDELVIILRSAEDGTLSVQESASGEFAADTIRFASTGGTNQDLVSGVFEFEMRACRTLEVPQEQEQDQEQDQEESKEIPQDKEQDQGEVGQDKEEGQDKAPEQECASISASLLVEEILQEKEQEQVEAPQDKEQVEEPQDKEQEQEQEQEEVGQDKDAEEAPQDKDDADQDADEGQDQN